MIPRVVPRGRSQLVESFVWLFPFLCVKREERGEKREDEREDQGIK